MKHWLILLSIVVLSVACGSDGPDSSGRALTTNSGAPQTSQNILLVSPMEHFFAFNEVEGDPGKLKTTSREISDTAFEVNEEARISLSGIVEGVVTGLGVEIKNGQDETLEVDLAVAAKRFDPETMSLVGETKVYKSRSDMDFLRGQDFELEEEKNRMLSGLALSATHANVTAIRLETKTLEELEEGEPRFESPLLEDDTESSFVKVDPGYVIVGFHIRIQKPDEQENFPFLSDVRLDSTTFGTVN